MNKVICMEPTERMPFIVNIGIHVMILFTILTVFFMFFIAKISTQAFADEIRHNLNDAMSGVAEFKSKNPNVSKLLANNGIVNSLNNAYDQPNESVELNNKWLFKTMILTNIMIFIIVTVSILLITKQCGQCIPLKHILLENLFTFACVGAVEYMFFKHVALKFIPTKPSLIVNSFFSSVEKRLI